MLLSALLISGIAGHVADRIGLRAAKSRTKPGFVPGTSLVPLKGAPAPVAETAQNDKLFLMAGGATLMCVAAAPVVPAMLLLAPAIAVIGTMPFLRSAVAHWKTKRRPNDEAVSVLTLLGVVSVQNFLAVGLTMMLWWVRQTLLLATKDRSRREIGELFGRSVPTAWLVTPGEEGGQETEVAIERLAVGDLIAVHAGEVIPVDGVVSAGAGRADQRMLTGEEFPADLTAGAQVHAMTQLVSGRVVVRVERAGAETTAGRIVELLNRTTEHRLTTEIEAKRIADGLAPYYFGFGMLTVPFLGLYGASCALMTLP